jgi:hypothetical protein
MSALCSREIEVSRAGGDKEKLVWSCVFPLPPGKEVPPEAFLQLPLRQGFKPQLFLDGVVVLTLCAPSIRPTRAKHAPHSHRSC